MSSKNNGPFARAHWWKSTRSGGSGGACVEFTDGPLRTHGVIGVRDTKDQGNGPIIAVSGPAWAAFAAAVKGGQFDL